MATKTNTEIATTDAEKSASEKLQAMMGTEALMPSEPQKLEDLATWSADNVRDGSYVADPDRFLKVIGIVREEFGVLDGLVEKADASSKVIAEAIAALRRTVRTSDGKIDYCGDSYVWKTWIGPKLKREITDRFGDEKGGRLWNTAVTSFHGTHLTIPTMIIADAIASKQIPAEDVKAYKAIMSKNGNDLGRVRKNDMTKVPESICTLVNTTLDASAQKRDGWKLVPPAPRLSRGQKIKADPAKALTEATATMLTVANVDGNGDGPKYDPLASIEKLNTTYFALLRSVLIEKDGTPRKGGVANRPQVIEAVKTLRAGLDAFIVHEEKGGEIDEKLLSLLPAPVAPVAA